MRGVMKLVCVFAVAGVAFGAQAQHGQARRSGEDQRPDVAPADEAVRGERRARDPSWGAPPRSERRDAGERPQRLAGPRVDQRPERRAGDPSPRPGVRADRWGGMAPAIRCCAGCACSDSVETGVRGRDAAPALRAPEGSARRRPPGAPGLAAPQSRGGFSDPSRAGRPARVVREPAPGLWAERARRAERRALPSPADRGVALGQRDIRRIEPARRSALIEILRERVRRARDGGAAEDCPPQDAPALHRRGATLRRPEGARRGVDPV